MYSFFKKTFQNHTLKKPWLFLPASLSHQFSTFFLKLYSLWPFRKETPSWGSLRWKGLHFPTPLGVAGGVDKNAKQIHLWSRLGAGFVELGTVTPRPQKPQPGVILRRSIPHQSLWNRMGFPNDGALAIKERLHTLSVESPLFINVGKNRDTLNKNATQDYLDVIDKLYPYADAFVVNISSPNSEGLRDLLQPQYLEEFLAPIVKRTKKLRNAKDKSIPILLKLSPDLSATELQTIINTTTSFERVSDSEVDGWILGNTTTHRHENSWCPPEGGLSGKDLAPQSLNQLKQLVSILGERKKERLLISCGGVLTSAQVLERLEAGADLVQVYSALVFEGPGFFNKVAQSMNCP